MKVLTTYLTMALGCCIWPAFHEISPLSSVLLLHELTQTVVTVRVSPHHLVLAPFCTVLDLIRAVASPNEAAEGHPP